MADRESSGDIDDAAARWAARLDRGPLSPEEAAELDRWARADSRRQGALARVLAISARFDGPDVQVKQADPAVRGPRPRR